MSVFSLRSSTRDERQSSAAAAGWWKIVCPVVAFMMVGAAVAVSSFFPWGQAHPRLQLALLGLNAVVAAVSCISWAIVDKRS